MFGRLADCRKSALTRLEARHGPFVVAGRQRLVVVHNFGLMMRYGIDNIVDGVVVVPVRRCSIEKFPLKHVRTDLRGNVRTWSIEN